MEKEGKEETSLSVFVIESHQICIYIHIHTRNGDTSSFSLFLCIIERQQQKSRLVREKKRDKNAPKTLCVVFVGSSGGSTYVANTTSSSE